jgi:hypothetical protein
MPDTLLGPLAALSLSLLILGLFYTGKILPRNTVPREDFKQLQDVNATQAEGLRTVTQALNELITIVRQQQRNGGSSV